MATKILYSYAVKPKTRKDQVLEFLAGLQAQPQHKWVPIEEMSESARATLTTRQANWIEAQVEKQVEGVGISFELVPQVDED